MGNRSPLQGLFLTQGTHPGHLHCRWILYHLATREPKNTGVGSLSLLQGIFLTQESTWGLLHCGRALHQPSRRGALHTVSVLMSRWRLAGRRAVQHPSCGSREWKAIVGAARARCWFCRVNPGLPSARVCCPALPCALHWRHSLYQ